MTVYIRNVMASRLFPSKKRSTGFPKITILVIATDTVNRRRIAIGASMSSWSAEKAFAQIT